VHPVVPIALSFWSFATLDHAIGVERGGATLATSIQDTSDSDGTPVTAVTTRLDVHGELVRGPWSLVATVPLVWVHGNEEHVGLGAVHVGGAWAHHQGDLTLRARLGATLPTDTFVPDTGYEAGVAAFGPTFHRLEEPAIDRGSAWLGGGGTARLERGAVTAQVDLLAQVPLEGFGPDDVHPVRVSLGLGAAVRVTGTVHVSGELVVAGFPGGDALEPEQTGDGGDLSERTLTSACVGVSGAAGAWRVGAHGLVPLDSYLRTHWVVLGVSAEHGF
jgi:hypothetical protein